MVIVYRPFFSAEHEQLCCDEQAKLARLFAAADLRLLLASNLAVGRKPTWLLAATCGFWPGKA